MKKTVIAVGFLAATSFATSAFAAGMASSRTDKDGGFYATPVQKGAPRDLPGEQLIPGINPIVDVVDGVTRPLIIDPIQGIGASLAPPTAPAPAPMVRRHRHHHHHHHHHM